MRVAPAVRRAPSARTSGLRGASLPRRLNDSADEHESPGRPGDAESSPALLTVSGAQAILRGMNERDESRELDEILRGVSRSIYLTLKVAPRAMRPALGVGYLFCRAADTIADTRLIPRGARLDALARFREQFSRPSIDVDALRAIGERVGAPQENPDERALLRSLVPCFRAYLRLSPADRDRLARLVSTLTSGMEMDLRFFPPEESGVVRALPSDAALDLYTYHVAGCVGEFWTELQLAHRPSLAMWNPSIMADLGVRFGKGLQMTNILRDLPADLAIGRCYLPEPALESVGVSVDDLAARAGLERLRPVVLDLIARTLALYRSGWEYVTAIPRREVRLRLACAWPLLIGLETFARLAASEDPYAPGEHHKISRTDVYRIIRQSAVRAASTRKLSRLYDEREARVLAHVAGPYRANGIALPAARSPR